MKVVKILIAIIVLFVVQMVWGGLTCGWLFKWMYSLEPTNIWNPSPELNVIALYKFVFTVITVIVYVLIRKGLPGTRIVKGLCYGFFIWLVGKLPIISCMSILTIISHEVIVYWIINYLILSLISGWIIAAICEEK